MYTDERCNCGKQFELIHHGKVTYAVCRDCGYALYHSYGLVANTYSEEEQRKATAYLLTIHDITVYKH